MIRSSLLSRKPFLHPLASIHGNPCNGSPPRSFVVTAGAATNAESFGIRSSRTTLYQVLRIKQTASQTEIKNAYRSLAKLCHPDAASSDSDGEDFIAIHDAYATLSDPMARARYDLSISTIAAHQQQFRYPRKAKPQARYQPFRRWETDQCW